MKGLSIREVGNCCCKERNLAGVSFTGILHSVMVLCGAERDKEWKRKEDAQALSFFISQRGWVKRTNVRCSLLKTESVLWRATVVRHGKGKI